MLTNKKALIYGYGNPGRFDDGLGIRLAEEMEKWLEEEGIENVDCDSNYQLNIEDAEAISNYDLVIFADASQEEIDDIKLSRIDPSDSKIEFSMHAVSPAFVLDLCQKMFDRQPDAILLHIKGYEWQFGEGLSKEAKKNLETAINKMKEFVYKYSKLLVNI